MSSAVSSESIYCNNSINAPSRMYGVVDKLFLCQNERTDELNHRISSRNIPSAPLQPFYYQVPVSTKYGYMQILDQTKGSSVPLNNYPIFSPHDTFNPGNNMAPWHGFANNVNIESTLRNQFFAMQECEQAYYVPSSKSDLYNVVVPPPSQPVTQQFPGLFQREVFDHFNPNTNNLGNSFFNNSTRTEIKDIPISRESSFCSS
jgi:hypothetical protein